MPQLLLSENLGPFISSVFHVRCELSLVKLLLKKKKEVKLKAWLSLVSLLQALDSGFLFSAVSVTTHLSAFHLTFLGNFCPLLSPLLFFPVMGL